MVFFVSFPLRKLFLYSVSILSSLLSLWMNFFSPSVFVCVLLLSQVNELYYITFFEVRPIFTSKYCVFVHFFYNNSVFVYIRWLTFLNNYLGFCILFSFIIKVLSLKNPAHLTVEIGNEFGLILERIKQNYIKSQMIAIKFI